MEIDINQHKISIGDKYKIFTDGQLTYTAARALFNLLPVVNLFILNEGRARMTIRKRLSWFIAKYDIERWDNIILKFRTISFWKLSYRCQCGNDTYNVYGHTGRKYSVFKNDIQVAYWTKETVSWFAGDNYKIVADNDCDKDLLISFCLIVDNFRSDDHDSNTVNIDFGNIGLFAKKFDFNWQPTY